MKEKKKSEHQRRKKEMIDPGEGWIMLGKQKQQITVEGRMMVKSLKSAQRDMKE